MIMKMGGADSIKSVDFYMGLTEAICVTVIEI